MANGSGVHGGVSGGPGALRRGRREDIVLFAWNRARGGFIDRQSEARVEERDRVREGIWEMGRAVR